MKKYIMHCVVVSVLLFGSIASSMDMPVDTLPNQLAALNDNCNPEIPVTKQYDCSGFSVRAYANVDSYKYYYQKNKQAICDLLTQNPDFSVANENISCILQGALCIKDTDMLKLLFQRGANPNEVDNFGTPLFFKIIDLEIANIFFEQKSINPNASFKQHVNALWYTFDSTNLNKQPMVSFFLEKRIDPNKVDSNNNNLLHHIARLAPYRANITNKSKCLDFLLATQLILEKINPDKINAQNNDSLTPVDIINRHSKNKITSCLNDCIILFNNSHKGYLDNNVVAELRQTN